MMAGTDGPAQLPQTVMSISMNSTPSNGNTIKVQAGGSVQNALNQAKCGDTVELTAGATYIAPYQGFKPPVLTCTNTEWIRITTTAYGNLPPPGTRLTPCYAGVKSLPGRPPYGCSTTRAVTAKIVATGNYTLNFLPNANHIRVIGLELTKQAKRQASSLVKVAGNNIIIDRCWIHGDPVYDTKGGVGLNDGSTYIAVVDSYLNDFHCEAYGGSACTQAQAIHGGLGNTPQGVYSIIHNFLESDAGGVMFGGGGATVTPSDITIQRNHIFKPLTWMPGNPHHVVGPHGRGFTVTNNFELKNADRLLFEGNLLENVWGNNDSMHGRQIVLTPKNQGNTCPSCKVTNITIRYTLTKHSGSGFVVAAGASDAGGLAQGLANISIHDVVLDDVDAETYLVNGYNAPPDYGDTGVIGTGATPGMYYDNVTISNITAAFATQTPAIMVGSTNPSPVQYVSLTNSIMMALHGEIASNGAGGTDGCGYMTNSPVLLLSRCWGRTSGFTNNVMVGGTKTWPTGNFSPATPADVGFVNYKGGNGGNYTLAPSSQFYGKNIGADIQQINAELKGVP
jgi:hypothetical protein